MIELLELQKDMENLGYPTKLESGELVVMHEGLVAVWINEDGEMYSKAFKGFGDKAKGQISHLIMRYRQGRMAPDYFERRFR